MSLKLAICVAVLVLHACLAAPATGNLWVTNPTASSTYWEDGQATVVAIGAGVDATLYPVAVGDVVVVKSKNCAAAGAYCEVAASNILGKMSVNSGSLGRGSNSNSAFFDVPQGKVGGGYGTR